MATRTLIQMPFARSHPNFPGHDSTISYVISLRRYRYLYIGLPSKQTHLRMSENFHFREGKNAGLVFFNLLLEERPFQDVKINFESGEHMRAFARVLTGYIGETDSPICLDAEHEPSELRFFDQKYPIPITKAISGLLDVAIHRLGQTLHGEVPRLDELVLGQRVHRVLAETIFRPCDEHGIPVGEHDNVIILNQVNRSINLTISRERAYSPLSCFTYPFDKPHFHSIPRFEEIDSFIRYFEPRPLGKPAQEPISYQNCAKQEWEDFVRAHQDANVADRPQMTGGNVWPVWCMVLSQPIEMALIMLPADFSTVDDRVISIVETAGLRLPRNRDGIRVIPELYLVAKTDGETYPLYTDNKRRTHFARWIRVRCHKEEPHLVYWALALMIDDGRR